MSFVVASYMKLYSFHSGMTRFFDCFNMFVDSFLPPLLYQLLLDGWLMKLLFVGLAAASCRFTFFCRPSTGLVGIVVVT